MKRFLIFGVTLLSLISMQAFSQSGNASLSGTVSDAAGALIPGVTVTATNVSTGIISTAVSNETGTYNVPSLLPGVYTVSAELTGFQTRTFTEVRLGNAAQVRLNFALQVAALNTSVEVTASAAQLLLESTSSVGAVLAEKTVRDLPVVGVMGNDTLTLMRTMPGVNMADDLVNNANDTKLAGVSAANIQIQRDGVEASSGARWPTGISSATTMNPDLVGEVRMILAPVDAEVGRGNSQIQVLTRSGTNRYRGAAVWYVQNSALDPNTWANKRVAGDPVTRPFTNLQEYTASVGGPIVRNKTFFFALWDGLLPTTRANVNATVLTPCARRGIFRYYDNWSNGSAFQATSTGATPRIAVVDEFGNPKAPATNPNGTPHNGILRYASVFGPLQNTPTRPDCSDAVVQGQPWDPYRTQVDPTGYIRKLFSVMPEVNNGEIGDGLNSAGYRWVRTLHGSDNRFSIGAANVRKQINIKIDHNFNAAHKINAGWSFERANNERSGVWPFHFNSYSFRQPQVLTANFTSTLSPTLLNEARFGMRRTGTNTPAPFRHHTRAQEALDWFPNINGIPLVGQLGTHGAGNTQNGVICVCGGQPFPSETNTRFLNTAYEKTPLFTYADSISWTHGVHAFKGGVEVRIASSELSEDNSGNDYSIFARGFGGETPLSQIQGITSTNMPGLQGTATTGNNLAMRSLLNLLSGSLSRVTQLYWIGSAQRLDTWDDWRVSQLRTRELNQNEMSIFLKDDWKVHRDLTLNLGVRWDYYGVPWVSDGLTPSPVGGGDGLFGYSGRGFKDWMRPGQRGENTQLIFVGPGSPNPNLMAWPKDWNNIGPAVGFAWQVPWFGAGQTTIRGGYQISFLPGGSGRFNVISTPLSNPPGSSYQASVNGGPGELEYLDLTDLQRIIPVPVPARPMEPIPFTARDTGLAAFDSNYVTPYVQNMTLAVTRNIGRNVVADVRYIGTLSKKLYGTMDLNSPNFLYNGLKEAFDAARGGAESALLDQMFQGINIAGAGFGAVGTVFNGVPQTGALHLRSAAASQLRNNLANGNYQALANSLFTLNYSKAGGINAGLPDIPVGVNGAVLRYTGFPENFIKTNPQFSTATYHSNLGSTNYHSLQSQFTLRPTAGLTFQAAYTWSKLLGYGGNFTNPVDRKGDYSSQVGDRRHDFRTNGAFELPLGPGHLMLRNSTGVLARLVEGWQMSWILNLSSGEAANIVAQNMVYNNGVPDVVGPFDPKQGKVRWADGARNGNYFGDAYHKVTDPQCSTIAPALQSLCTLTAIADSSEKIILQNSRPGTRGNLGQKVIELPGIWSLDGAISRSFRISENRRFQIRMDATNIFNHPVPADPNLDINNADVPFGDINTKNGNRQFQLQLRLEF
jgi:hypothetical protein